MFSAKDYCLFNLDVGRHADNVMRYVILKRVVGSLERVIGRDLFYCFWCFFFWGGGGGGGLHAISNTFWAIGIMKS